MILFKKVCFLQYSDSDKAEVFKKASEKVDDILFGISEEMWVLNKYECKDKKDCVVLFKKVRYKGAQEGGL